MRVSQSRRSAYAILELSSKASIVQINIKYKGMNYAIAISFSIILRHFQ